MLSLTPAIATPARSINDPNMVSIGPIRSMISGKCATVSDWNSYAPTAVVLQDCNGNLDQRWIEYADHTLVSSSGQCLSAGPTGDSKYSTMQVVTCDGSLNQAWQRYGNNAFRSDTGWCIDDPSSSTANGVQLRLWDCNGTNAQYYSEPGGPLQSGVAFGSNHVEAELYNGSGGVGVNSTPAGTRFVGWISNGDWTQYNNVNFFGGSASITLVVAPLVDGSVEVHIDTMNNAPVATLPLTADGLGPITFVNRTFSIPQIGPGYHTVLLRYLTGASGDFMNLDYFYFS